jgi:hypothetical protein
MALGASTGEHGRNFRPIWLEGKNPPDKWAYLNIYDVRTSLRFDSFSLARCLCSTPISRCYDFDLRIKLLERTAEIS